MPTLETPETVQYTETLSRGVRPSTQCVVASESNNKHQDRPTDKENSD